MNRKSDVQICQGIDHAITYLFGGSLVGSSKTPPAVSHLAAWSTLTTAWTSVSHIESV